MSVEDWVLLRNGRAYQFAFTAYVRPATAEIQIFETSARSIRFSQT